MKQSVKNGNFYILYGDVQMAKTASTTTLNPYVTLKSNVVPLVTVATTLFNKLKFTPKKFDKSLFNKFAWIDPHLIDVNFGSQRWPDEPHIGKLVKNFNPYKCTPLVCVYRTDLDRYRVCDGLQHGSAMLVTFFGCLSNGLEVPVWYVETDDERVEHDIFLALNRDNLPMAKYFIHDQEVKLKVAKAVEIERIVKRAGAFTAYSSRKSGAITHISDLYTGHKVLGKDCLQKAIECLRDYFPDDKIHTASMLGIGKVLFLLKEKNLLTDNTVSEIGAALFANFDDSNRLHLDIKEQFSKDHPSNYKGMNAMEKVASGIIDVYEQHYKKNIGVAKPFDITMPVMVDLSKKEGVMNV
jgi:hypothetical protein